MTDPDAPSPSEPSMREWVHWSVSVSAFMVFFFFEVILYTHVLDHFVKHQPIAFVPVSGSFLTFLEEPTPLEVNNRSLK